MLVANLINRPISSGCPFLLTRTLKTVVLVRFHLQKILYKIIHSPLIFYNELCSSSEHTTFLSLRTVHHMHSGMALHHLLFPTSAPPLFQHLKISQVVLGITHFMFTRAINSCDNRVVTSEYTNRWLLSSWSTTIDKYILANKKIDEQTVFTINEGKLFDYFNYYISRLRRKKKQFQRLLLMLLYFSCAQSSVLFRKANRFHQDSQFYSLHMFNCKIILI